MTDEEFIKKIANTPLPVIATGLLALENNRESALGKMCGEIETKADSLKLDSLKLSDEERRKQFGARVRTMRRLLGLTQAELAAKLKSTAQNVAFYETGRREPPFKNLIALSQTLGVTIDWLLGNEPPQTLQ